MLESTAFRVVSVISLAIALFSGSLCVLFDLPDDPTNIVMDVIMLTVTAVWLGEFTLRCCLRRAEYLFSFFCWMDFLSICSMVFEVSFLLGAAGKELTVSSGSTQSSVRLAQFSRVALRFARLCKPLRCLSLLYIGRQATARPVADGYSAKLLGAKITQAFSAKVATLTVVLVLGVPLFSIGRYPEADFSLRFSSIKLEADYARAFAELASGAADASAAEVRAAVIFEASVSEVLDFYADFQYFPYRLAGYPSKVTVGSRQMVIAGSARLAGEEPRRRQNVVVQEVARCLVARPGCEGDDRATVEFDFKVANQYGAMIDIAIIIFIVLCMGLVVCVTTSTMNRMVVDPMAKMLLTAHSMASVLNQAIKNSGNDSNGEVSISNPVDGVDFSDDPCVDETELLERLFKKMALLTSVFVERSVVDDAKMQSLDQETKGIIVDVMRCDRGNERRLSGKGSALWKERVLSDAPVPDKEMESWSLNVLGVEAAERPKLIYHILFDSDVGHLTGRIWLEFETFSAFTKRVEACYLDNPYHCFAHGVDVLSSSFRILRAVKWDEWLTDVDATALLVAALCHDIAHPGKTNPFLVETGDALALTYNDKSPLENMHCARMFEICRESGHNVFQIFDRESYKQARSVCIAAILFTDNALHFDLVKEIKKVYETSNELCDGQGVGVELDGQYVQEALVKNTMLWIKVILHLADVSNPMKTFEINKLWAMRVVDEFFAQGDEEKRLGLPVGMLNDRDKVSRLGAEHGFINFLLCPLVVSTVSVFPMLHPLAAQMASNMASWKELWKAEMKPSEEDIKKRTEDVAGVQEKVAALKARERPPVPSRSRSKTHQTAESSGTN